MERRRYTRSYDPLLPEFFPVKLIGAFISVDFVAGCSFGCRFCISRRHPAREALFSEQLVVENRVSPRKVHAWLRAMPSWQAGVQLRIGHDTDAGLQFEKSAELLSLVEPDRSVVYLSRKPFTEREQGFFATYRPNLLLKLTATPRSGALGVTADPVTLVRSAWTADPRMVFWVVGPLCDEAGAEDEARRVLDALPPGSHLQLKPLNVAGLAGLGAAPMTPAALARLEAHAAARGLVATEWFCRRGLARVGRPFFDVDALVGQPPSPKRDRELAVCRDCRMEAACHGPIDEAEVRGRLEAALREVGLTVLSPPVRTGHRSFDVAVREPSSRGDETWLGLATGTPVRVRLSTRERGASEGGSFCNVDQRVLRRWYATGFLPVTELNRVAGNVLSDVRRLVRERGGPVAPSLACEGSGRC
jgi:hypothetical protein